MKNLISQLRRYGRELSICNEAADIVTDLAANWSRCSRDCARMQGERDKARAEIERLQTDSSRGWLEAAIAWEVCASIHQTWAKGKDALFTTRHADFVKHASDARQKALALTGEKQ